MRDSSGKSAKEKTINTKEIQKIIRVINEKYLEIVTRDPFLPKELLPYGWKANKVRGLMRGLIKELDRT